MNVEIDDETYEKLSKRAKLKGFESAEEYSAIILKTVIDELNESETDEKVQNRLEDLGYLE